MIYIKRILILITVCTSIANVLYAADQQAPGNFIVKFNQAAALGQSPIIMDRHKALGLYQELLNNKVQLPNIYEQSTRLNMALILDQHTRVKENTPNCAQRGVQLLEPLLRTEEQFISSDLLKHAASLTAHFYQCLNNKPREQFYRAWLLGESGKAGDRQKAVNLLKSIIKLNKDDPYYYCQARINLAQLFCLQLHPNRPIGKKRKFANQGIALLEPLVISNGLTVIPKHKVQAWDCMAEFYNYEQDHEKAIICDLNVIAESWNNGLEQYCQGAYERAMGHFAQMCVQDKKWKQVFNERFNDTGIEWVHFCKRAESFEIPDGTYLLAEHKIDCNTKGSLQKAERMLQTLIDEQYDQAVPALVYTKWKLSQEKDDEKPQETKKEAQKKSKLSKNQKKKQKKATDDKKQKEKRKKEAQEIITSLVTQPDRIDACVAYFQERAGNVGAQFVWHTIFMYPAKENSLRWKAAFELYKREKDSKKRDLYLMLAIQKSPKNATDRQDAIYSHAKNLIEKEELEAAQTRLKEIAHIHKKARLLYAKLHESVLDIERWLKPLLNDPDKKIACKAYSILIDEYCSQAKDVFIKAGLSHKQRERLVKGYYDKALELGKQVQKLDEVQGIIFSGFISLLKDNNMVKAKDILHKGLEQHPQNGKILYYLGKVYELDNDLVVAGQYYCESYKAKQKRSTKRHIISTIENLLDTDNWDAAVQIASQAHEVNSTDPDLQACLGNAYYTAGVGQKDNDRYEKSLPYFLEALAQGCEKPLFKVGYIYFDKGKLQDHEKAENYFKRVLTKKTSMPQALTASLIMQNNQEGLAWSCLGQIYKERKDHKQAHECFTQSFLRGNGNGIYQLAESFHNGMGGSYDILLAQQYYQVAAEAFEKLHPTMKNKMDAKGMLAFKERAAMLATLTRYQHTNAWKAIDSNKKELIAVHNMLDKHIKNDKKDIKKEAHFARAMWYLYLASKAPKKQAAFLGKVLQELDEAADAKTIREPYFFAETKLSHLPKQKQFKDLSDAEKLMANDVVKIFESIIENTIERQPHNYFLQCSFDRLAHVYKSIYNNVERQKKTLERGAACGFYSCCYNLGVYYQGGHFAKDGNPQLNEAKEWFQKVLTCNPSHQNARKRLAWINYLLKRSDENDADQQQYVRKINAQYEKYKHNIDQLFKKTPIRDTRNKQQNGKQKKSHTASSSAKVASTATSSRKKKR